MRDKIAQTLAAVAFCGLLCAILGAAFAPTSYLPQASFAVALMAGMGACWLSENR